MRGVRSVYVALALVAFGMVCISGCGRTSETSERGARIYALSCGACHGQNGEGGLGPELTGERYHKNEKQTVAWIKNALPPMPRLYPSPLSEQDVDDVAAFVTSL